MAKPKTQGETPAAATAESKPGPDEPASGEASGEPAADEPAKKRPIDANQNFAASDATLPPMPTLAKPTSELEAKLDEALRLNEVLRAENSTLKRRVEGLQRQIDVMVERTDGQGRALSGGEVARAIKADARAEFVVLEPYAGMGAAYEKGRTIRAKLFPQLLGHVQNGLRLRKA